MWPDRQTKCLGTNQSVPGDVVLPAKQQKTKNHEPGGLNNRHSFLPVPEAGH